MESAAEFGPKQAQIQQLDECIQPNTALSPRTQLGIYRALLVVNDMAMSLAAFLLATWTRFHVPLPLFNLNATPSVPSNVLIVFAFIPVWVMVFAVHGLYQQRILLGGTEEYARVFRAVAVGMLIIVVFGFFRPMLNPARGWVLVAWILSVALVISGRFILRRVVYSLRRQGYFLNTAIIVGDNDEAYSLAEQLKSWKTSGLSIQGFASTNANRASHESAGLPILGTADQLEDLVKQYNVSELVLATSALSQDQILSIFKQFGVSRDVNLRLSSGLFEVITTGLEVKEIASVPLLRINQVRLTGTDWVFKSILDMVIATAFLVFMSPLLLLIIIGIKLDSPGSAIYRRRVMGLNGKQFDALKFRTMFSNGGEILDANPDLRTELENNHKLKDDPRVTRIGRFLRKYSLDELPQFYNVLRRQMSVVGPRMITPDELCMYEQWDINLLTVPPGITGLWQVSGRSDVSYAERVQLDMRYIRNWSIWLDLFILMRTTAVVIKGEGAY